MPRSWLQLVPVLILATLLVGGDVGPARAAATPSFGPITFSRDVTYPDAQPIEPAETFAIGTPRVFASWDFTGMQDGQEWQAQWVYDGKALFDDPMFISKWTGGEAGRWEQHLSQGTVLDPGTYDLILIVERQELRRGSFTIK